MGIREQFVLRDSLHRKIISVKTNYGDIRVKIASYSENGFKVIPEYDDCHKVAIEKRKKITDIYKEAESLAISFIKNERK